MLFRSPSIKTLLGYTPEEIVGTDLSLFIVEEKREGFKKFIREHFMSKQGWEGRIEQWQHKNGSLKWLESSANPVIDTQGKFSGFRGSERDETERVSLDKMKDDFISMVSHELRTPLTSIRGALGLIASGHQMSPEKNASLMNIAHKSCERLVVIINDILDVQRIVGGNFAIYSEEINLQSFIDELITINTPFADKLGVSIEVQDVPQKVKFYSDPNRLMQVLTNLLTNAIKFSPQEQKVIIRIEVTDLLIRFFIIDKGPGISEKILPHLYERFVREDPPGFKALPGTGLGLNTSKIIVERLGGTLNFITKKGTGTTFFFALPRKGNSE